MMSIVKKFLMVAVFSFLLSGLSVTASYAACQPGCDCSAGGVMDAMKNHSDAQRVRDKAYARQIIKQNDNALGMTCFDHAMALSSRLGQIFSDVYPGAAFGAANKKVFGAVYDAGSGSTKMLADRFNQVVTPIISNHADGFADSLSSWLGAMFLGYLNAFMAPINAWITTINGFVSSMNAAITTLDSYVSTLQTVLDLLGATMPSFIPAVVAAIKAAWKVIEAFITATIQAIQAAIKAVVDMIKSYIMGAAASLLGAFNDAVNGACSRIQQLWGQNASDWLGSFRALQGGGTEQGTPYFAFFDLVKGGGPAGAGVDLLDEVLNASNSAIITKALNDITGAGVLTGPGMMPSWPTAPVFPPGTSVSAIIGAM